MVIMFSFNMKCYSYIVDEHASTRLQAQMPSSSENLIRGRLKMYCGYSTGHVATRK